MAVQRFSHRIPRCTKWRRAVIGCGRGSVSVALVLEYESVLLRPGLVPSFATDEIHRILDAICLMAKHHKVFFAWRPFLKDPNDDLVLELAVAASAP
jgi:predicted nucleic acid-binding protein